MKMSLRLRDQAMVLVSLAITFLILTVLKTRVHTDTDGFKPKWWQFRSWGKRVDSSVKSVAQNKDLRSRSIMLLAVSAVALVINVVSVPKKLRGVLNLVGGLVVVAAGLAVLLDFYDNSNGTIKQLKGGNATTRTAGIVGTVAGSVALAVGASHLVEACM